MSHWRIRLGGVIWKKTCKNFTNATQVMDAGLSPTASICLGCEFRENCEYRDRLTKAEAAMHRIATHNRGALSFAGLAKQTKYITIHEDPISLLSPVVTFQEGLEEVAKMAA